MNLQADLPNTLPGQNISFILLGDVEAENAVEPNQAFVPSDGMEITVTANRGANVRSGPGVNYNVIGGLQDGETVLADGWSEDGKWLRINYRERPAWISITVIDASSLDLHDSPRLTEDLLTPMQAFYLRTGIGHLECIDAPSDVMVVQGPKDIEVTITVNGARISLSSTGALRVLEIDEQHFLEIVVFDGEFRVRDVTIRRGQRSLLCLGDESSRGLDGEANDLIVNCEPS